MTPDLNHPSHEVLRSRILRIANLVGVKLDLEADCHRPNQYDGKTIACLYQRPSNVLHDIAHYMVSAPERRLLPDYGLGPGPESTSRGVIFRSNPLFELVKHEEMLASALGIAYEVYLGIDYGKTLVEHDWLEPREVENLSSTSWPKLVRFNKKKLNEAMQDLQKINLIDDQLLPKVR
jgi:hypothetical protein